jgi:hypothetical protein
MAVGGITVSDSSSVRVLVISAASALRRWAYKVFLCPSEKGDMGILLWVLLVVYKVV